LAGADLNLNTTNTENDLDMKKEAEACKLQRIAKVNYFLELAGQPKPTCCPEEMASSKPADACREIHFRHGRDHQSIVVTLST